MNNKNLKIARQFKAWFCCAIILFVSTMPLLVVSAMSLASEDEHGHEDENKHQEEFVVLPDKMAQSMNVLTQPVQPGQLNITSTVYGNIVTDPASLSHIRARFDGMITQVSGNLGDKVKKSQTLAIVESNESLKNYPVTAPLSGIVIARHANEGELSNGQVLFSIANYDGVWAQLRIFPKQLTQITEQLSMQLSHANSTQVTAIHYILPSPEEQPYVLAYAKIDNTSGQWPVGAAIKALVTTARIDVAMMVPKTAVQEYEDMPVVFIKQGNEYHPRSVVLGKSDSSNIEVLSGINTADEVVTQNSYLFKADLEKSEAGHAH